MARNALIVGVTGMAGRNLAEHLLATGGWTVRGIARNPERAPQEVEAIAVDLRDGATGPALAAPCHYQSQRTALSPRTWYGMPAYAKDGKVVCFFQSSAKFRDAVRHVGLSARSEPRRRRHVAGCLRMKELTASEEARIGRARKESGELTTE